MSFPNPLIKPDPSKHAWAGFLLATACALFFAAVFFEYFGEPFAGFDKRDAFLMAALSIGCLCWATYELLRTDSDWIVPVFVACVNGAAWMLLPIWLATTLTALCVAVVALGIAFISVLCYAVQDGLEFDEYY